MRCRDADDLHVTCGSRPPAEREVLRRVRAHRWLFARAPRAGSRPSAAASAWSAGRRSRGQPRRPPAVERRRVTPPRGRAPGHLRPLRRPRGLHHPLGVPGLRGRPRVAHRSYFDLCRTVIGRYGGTVEKFIGDAVMAVWGVPTAHEDDAERAVRAGLEIVESIAAMGADLQAPDLAMRVGVVTGEVAVTHRRHRSGHGRRGCGEHGGPRPVRGDARAACGWTRRPGCSAPRPSPSPTSASTPQGQGRAGPALGGRRRGRRRSAGASAWTAWRRRSTGRDRELRLVKELFHAAEESGRPRLVVVDGEPGVGKSRLVWEFEKYIDGLSALDLVASRPLPRLRRWGRVLGPRRGGPRAARAGGGRRRGGGPGAAR